MSTHYWGEKADGTWVLEVENTGLPSNSGKLTQNEEIILCQNLKHKGGKSLTCQI